MHHSPRQEENVRTALRTCYPDASVRGGLVASTSGQLRVRKPSRRALWVDKSNRTQYVWCLYGPLAIQVPSNKIDGLHFRWLHGPEDSSGYFMWDLMGSLCQRPLSEEWCALEHASAKIQHVNVRFSSQNEHRQAQWVWLYISVPSQCLEKERQWFRTKGRAKQNATPVQGRHRRGDLCGKSLFSREFTAFQSLPVVGWFLRTRW